MEDENSGYMGRMRQLREHIGLSQRKFSEYIGTSNSYMSAIESGRTIPGGDVLTKIASKFSGLSCRWLLTGEGDMFEVSLPVLQPEARENERAAERALESGETGDIGDSGDLQDVLNAARVGGQATQWAILEHIQNAGSEGTSLKELAAALALSADDLVAHIAILRRKGLIVAGLPDRLRLASTRVGLQARDMENAAQHIKEVLETLVRDVMPNAESRVGGSTLLTAEVRLPEGVAREMAKRILGDTMNRLQESEVESGPDCLEVIMGFRSTSLVLK